MSHLWSVLPAVPTRPSQRQGGCGACGREGRHSDAGWMDAASVHLEVLGVLFSPAFHKTSSKRQESKGHSQCEARAWAG